ncbi:unnamed protein product [Cuscuta epithymum]|uniref:Uncharacterized protein n=1 Tax=Cuscuta epithymum TaxID=186058 RepID=A0AAV0ENJ9_9ASTE|nr:unnamed protein product [Cuscuta epithymum]
MSTVEFTFHLQRHKIGSNNCVRGMAPGSKEKVQMKSQSQPSIRQHASKKASQKYVTLGGIRGVLQNSKTPVRGEVVDTRKRIFAQNMSSKRCATTTTQHSPESIEADASPIHENSVSGSPHRASPERTVEEASRPKKRGRGQTMGKGIMRAFAASKTKMKVTVDPYIGRPKDGEESAKLSSQIGIITRDVLPVPRRWKEVDEENGLEPGFDHIQMHMDVNFADPGVKESLIGRLKSSSRQKRYQLHMHYKQFQTLEEAKEKKPPTFLSQENWELLCDHFASPEFQKSSITNTENRKLVRAPHITGRKPFTVRLHEIVSLFF